MSASLRVIEPGDGRTVLVVVAHADDPALFLGGTVALWSRVGWRVVVLRMTDDRWDSVGLDEETTTSTNRAEFHAAADLLGVAEIVEGGLHTDRLGDESTVRLREIVIRAVRTHRPYALVGFDPYAMYGEDNLDHIAVARATDEAFWTSQFHLHHPEHLADGLEPHGCFERWYFGRSVVDVTTVVDISDTLDVKVAAARAHHTMLRHALHQLTLQARTGGWRLPSFEEAVTTGQIDELVDSLLRANSRRLGEEYGVGAAEVFRVVTFGGMTDLLEHYGVRR